VPGGQAANQVYYKEILTTLHEWAKKKYLKCGKMVHGFFTMTTHCQDISGEAQDPCVGTFILLT
jgi:hypothetical protein